MANEDLAVGKDDLVNLSLVEGRDSGPVWIKMMEKSLPTMTYQAWRRHAQEAIKFKPEFCDAHLNLGNLYKAVGMCQDAILCYQNAAQACPQNAIAYVKPIL